METNIASGRSNESSPSKKTKIQRHLTPDIVEINGRRLPKQVAEYALANDLTEDQLQEELAKLKKEKFNLRFQQATGQLENTARSRQVRRDVARINTILQQRRATAEAG